MFLLFHLRQHQTNSIPHHLVNVKCLRAVSFCSSCPCAKRSKEKWERIVDHIWCWLCFDCFWRIGQTGLKTSGALWGLPTSHCMWLSEVDIKLHDAASIRELQRTTFFSTKPVWLFDLCNLLQSLCNLCVCGCVWNVWLDPASKRVHSVAKLLHCLSLHGCLLGMAWLRPFEQKCLVLSTSSVLPWSANVLHIWHHIPLLAIPLLAWSEEKAAWITCTWVVQYNSTGGSPVATSCHQLPPLVTTGHGPGSSVHPRRTWISTARSKWAAKSCLSPTKNSTLGYSVRSMSYWEDSCQTSHFTVDSADSVDDCGWKLHENSICFAWPTDFVRLISWNLCSHCKIFRRAWADDVRAGLPQ